MCIKKIKEDNGETQDASETKCISTCEWKDGSSFCFADTTEKKAGECSLC